MEEKKQSSRLWLWLGAAILVVIVFFVTRSLTAVRLTVRETKVSRQRVDHTFNTNGRVEPVMPYEVFSPVSSSVKAVFVQQGENVAAGKPLLQLDDMQALARVASAESGVKAAQAALDAATHTGSSQERQASASDIARARIDRDQAQHDLDALTKLKATGAASDAEVYSAKQRLETTDAALRAAQQGETARYAPVDVSRARAALADAEAGLAAARAVEAQTAPRAPISGNVYSIKVNRSDFVEQGASLLQIADLSNLRVRAYFDEPEIGQLAVGQKVQIKWDGDPKIGHFWSGHIARTPTTVEQYTTRTVGVALIQIDGGDGGLLPDLPVSVTVTTSSVADALTIPHQALYFENGKPVVFKIVGDELIQTPVTVGTSSLTLTPILSGLQEGDVIATGSTSGLPLQDGVHVKVAQ